jgi:hypothetical protein
VDTATRKSSVTAVIRLVNPEIKSKHASTYFTRLATEVPEIATQCGLLQINGKVDSPVRTQRPWSKLCGRCPGRPRASFVVPVPKTVCHALGGNLRLVDEIEARHHAPQGSEEGLVAQAFMLADSDDSSAGFVVTKRMKSSPPDELQLATAEQKAAFFQGWMVECAAECIADRRIASLKMRGTS